MKHQISLIMVISLDLLISRAASPQAFGDYGRTLGGIPRAGGSAPRAPGGGTQGGGVSGVVEDIGGSSLPTRLVVTSKSAGLYPRQDDETEVLDRLSEGETLVTMVQARGGNDWFMVKTAKGAIGWVKSADVREAKVKK